MAWSHERQQAYTSKQAAQLEVSKLEKSVEVTCREIWKAKAEKDRLKTAMEEAELTLQKAQQTHKEELAKLRSARATSQLEEQRLDAIRVREESEGTSVPADDDDDKAPKQGSGLTLAQEQGIMREVQKKFGIHAPQLQEILGPLAQIFVAALRPSFMEGLSSIPAETKTPTSALDSEAMAEAEEIKEENANAINETLGHEAQIGEKEAWDLAAKKCKEELQHERNLSFLEVKDASAMDAETERAAQIKRPMEVEIDTIGGKFEDVFSLQEQQDIQAALELSRADQKDQDAAVPGAKSRRTSEAPVLSGTELAAKALEDLEAARKEIEAKPGSADPAAANSASSSSNMAVPAGGAARDNLAQASSSSQGGSAPASG